MIADDPSRRAQRLRLAWMPWLFRELDPAARARAAAWQAEVHAAIVAGGGVTLAESAFVAPDARLLAEPGRVIEVGAGAAIGAECFLHGPITLGERVLLHPRVSVDGARAGVVVGPGSRIGQGASLFAFDHGLDPTAELMDQPVTSRGIRVGRDVWIGHGAMIADGVTVGDHAIVEIGAVVTVDVPDWGIVAGSPARVVGDRRDLET